MSGLRELVETYLRVRRALGYKLEREEYLLGQFCDYLEQEKRPVTVESMVGWAIAPGGSPGWHRLRLIAVRSFTRWAHGFDPGIPVPPAGLLPRRCPRAVPYIYTPEQIAALMSRAGSLPRPMVAATYRTLIGLLAATGLRVGEAINADRANLRDGVLTIADTKFGKTRLIPLHPSVQEVLTGYQKTREQLLGSAVTDALLVSSAGTRLLYKNVHFVFHRLVTQAGIEPRSPGCRPRIHDLRHTFAVRTMIDAYHEGDPSGVLPVLSTYLGHANPGSTYWYLEAVPELLGEAALRLATLEPGTVL